MAKILLVDDAEDILFLLEQSFTKAGHFALSTSDPRRVLPMVRNSRFDAIVLDVMMPRISGWSLLEQIREQEETRTTPVVMLTALSSVEHRVRGLRAGADDYLSKPFEPSELIARVEGLIQRRVTPAAALQGQLDVQSVQDVLQQLEQSRKTGRLDLTRGGDSGKINLCEGAITWAQHGRLEGEEAVLSLLDFTSGSFRFDPGNRNVRAQSGLSLRVSPLLIHNAWIDDELAKRRHFLPASSERLRLDQSPPKSPEDVPELPLDELAGPLSLACGVSVGELVAECQLASKKILLAVAWLSEQGLMQRVDPSPGPSDEETLDVLPESEGWLSEDELAETLTADREASEADRLEELDVAVREFLQSSLHRGLSLESIRLEIFLEASVWEAGLALLSSIPESVSSIPRPDAPTAFSCPLLHPAGRMDLGLTPLSRDASLVTLPEPPENCAGIVLWFGENGPLPGVDFLGGHLASRAPAAACLLLSGLTELGNDPAVARLASDPRWHLPDSLPQTFDQLLLELTRADLEH